MLRLVFLMVAAMCTIIDLSEALEFLSHHTLIHYLVNGTQLIAFTVIAGTCYYAAGRLSRGG